MSLKQLWKNFSERILCLVFMILFFVTLSSFYVYPYSFFCFPCGFHKALQICPFTEMEIQAYLVNSSGIGDWILKTQLLLQTFSPLGKSPLGLH